MSPRSTQNGGVLHPDAPISLRIGAKVTGIDPATKTVLVESTGHGGPLGAPTRDQPRPGAHDRNRPRPGAHDRNRSGAEAAAIERIGYDVLVLVTDARHIAAQAGVLPAYRPLPGRSRDGAPVFDVRIRDGVIRLSIPGNTDEMAVGA
jgi:hypothetical protein